MIITADEKSDRERRKTRHKTKPEDISNESNYISSKQQRKINERDTISRLKYTLFAEQMYQHTHK